MKCKFPLLIVVMLLFMSKNLQAQDDCGCPHDYDPVCAVLEDSIYLEFPNACLAECFGFTVVQDSSLCQWSDPWDDCQCPEICEPVCAVDTAGFYMVFPNECYAECFGFTVVEDSTLCELPDPWEDCLCPEIYDPVCAVDSSGLIYFEFPNACYAECLGFTVITDSTLCGGFDPWEDCNCPEPDSTFVCAQDSFGNIFPVPNECFAICWGLTLVEDGECDQNPYNDCECPFDENEPFICAQDSAGHACYVPNACFAACWGLTVVDDEACDPMDIDPEIDEELLACLDSLEITEDMTFQEILLLMHTTCNVDLPECVLEAPVFENDSLFFMYLFENCPDGFGFNDNPQSNVMNLFNRIVSGTSSSLDIHSENNISVQILENPVQTAIKYQLNGLPSGKIQRSLTDVHGKQVFRDTKNMNTLEGIQWLDVSALPNGIYLLRISSVNLNHTEKIIIAR